MKKRIKNFSLSQYSIRNKLMVSYCLTSIIPMLVFVYLIFLLYNSQIQWNYLSILVLITILLSWLGFLLAKGFSDELIDMSIQARLIIDGDLNNSLHSKTNDELSDIAKSINYFAKRLRDDISQIKDYRQRTSEINEDIQQKMKMLGGLLDIIDKLSERVTPEKIQKIILEKIESFYDSGIAAIFAREKDKYIFQNGSFDKVMSREIKMDDQLLSSCFLNGKIFVIDSTTVNPLGKKEIIKRFNMNNAIFLPVIRDGKTEKIMVSGNNIPNFSYTNDDVEILKLYAKQLSLCG
ncbi:MAG: hypothetical protein PHQ52_00885 [Candidatus Omnitrophica bacterium]|nr:hypothetical protein [Candidatus Omnitrophota bacterium]